MIPQSRLIASTQYHEAGYWVGPRMFDDETIASLRAACGQVLSGDLEEASPHFQIDDTQPAGGLRRAFNSQCVNSVICAAVCSPSIGRLAANLMGVASVQLWYSQIIEKPPANRSIPNNAANVGWHQDYRYWQCCKPPKLLTAWIALQQTNHTNGAMRVVLGSHKWGLLPTDRGFNTRDIDEMRGALEASARSPWHEESCELHAGQISFHHCLTLHASGPNKTDESRVGIAVHLMPSGTVRGEAAECHASLTFLGKLPNPGAVFDGKQWPVIS